MVILGADVSHFQAVNFAQVRTACSFVVLKATEGVGYTDPTFASRRQQAHAAGLIVGFYHFGRAGNAAAEAAYFLSVVGALQPGEFLVLDQEVPNSVAWCQQWLDAVYKATGVRPLIYMNQSASTGLGLGDWSGVAADYGLWLARYDNSTAQPSVPFWGAPAMKQYSDRGQVPGVGACDVDVFYGTTAQLLAYGKGGQPASVIGAPDMKLARTPDGTVWAVTDTRVVALTDPNLANDLAAVWGPPVALQSAAGVSGFADQVRGLAEGTLVGYGQRIERIDEGLHGGWGYGNRIEDTQTKVDALAAAQPAASVDPVAFAAAIFGDPAKVDALGAAIAKHMQLTSN